MTKEAVVLAIKKKAEGYPTAKAAAEALGVTAQYMKDVLEGSREPGPLMLKGLGLERVTSYRKVVKA